MIRFVRRGVLFGLGAGLAMAGALSGAEAQTTSLNFLAAERPDVVKPAIDAFEAANPDVKVVYTQVPFDSLNAQGQARIGAQDAGIDVYLADTPRIPAFASRGYLMDLSEYRPQVEGVANATAMNAVSYDGKVWAFPMWTSTQLLFFNRDLIAKAGLEPPGASEQDRLTWDALVERATKAKAGGSPWGFSFEQVDRYYQLQPLFESAGGGSGLTGDGNLTPEITNAAWTRTAEWYQTLFSSGISPRGVPPEQIPDLFASGGMAFFVGGPWNFERFNAAPNLHYGVAPVPSFKDGKPATPTDSWAVGINPYTANRDVALKFAQFLTLDPRGNALTVSANPLPPTNTKAYQGYIEAVAKIPNGVGEPARNIITYEIGKTAVGRPRSVGYVAFEEVMNRAFSDIRNGSDVRQTLDQAQSQLASTLSRIR